jgi:hypothetical protein
MSIAHRLLLVTAALLVPDALRAQTPATSLEGTRVRVTSDVPVAGTRVTGTLTTLPGDSLRIERDGDAGPVTFAATDIRTLERHAGTRSHAGTGAIVGMTLGAVAGAIGSIAFCANFTMMGSDPSCEGSAAAQAGALGGLGGAAVGGLLGALIGSVISGPKWERVGATPAMVGAAPGVALSWRF